jgi:hypothetical protein
MRADITTVILHLGQVETKLLTRAEKPLASVWDIDWPALRAQVEIYEAVHYLL